LSLQWRYSKTRDQIISDFLALEAAHPSLVSHESIGKTVGNRDILMFKIGNPSGGRVLWVGAIHGREQLGTEVLLLYAKWLLEKQEPVIAEKILKENYQLIIPIFNVDNYGVTRKNANGVDLNRNFPEGWGGGSSDPAHYAYRGVASASEPETQAMLACLAKWKPKFLLDYHIFANPVMLRDGTPSKKPADVSAEAKALLYRIRDIAQSRGVFQYPSGSTLGTGGALANSCYVYGGGAIGYMTEGANCRDAEDKMYQCPIEDVPAIHFPNFLPYAIGFNEEAAIPADQQGEANRFLLPIFAALLLLLLSFWMGGRSKASVKMR